VIVTLQKDNVAMIRIMKKDRLMNNFHLVEITLTRWKIPSKLCKLMFLQQHCDVNEHNIFSLVKDQNIQRKKCGCVLHHCNNLKVCCVSTNII
jgi:hypothetical protein